MNIMKRIAVVLLALGSSVTIVACAKEPETSIDKVEIEPPAEVQEEVEPQTKEPQEEATEPQEEETTQPQQDSTPKEETPQQEEKAPKAEEEAQPKAETKKSTGGVDENGFPVNPKNNQTANVDGVEYVYDGLFETWIENIPAEVEVIDNSDVDMTPLY